MARRIRKRERVSARRGSRALVAALAACVMCCASESANAGDSNAGDGAYPADSTGNLVKTRTGVERSEPLFVLDAMPADLHGVIEAVRAPRTGSGCDHWADPDSRAGMLVPLLGAAWLLVGERGGVRRGTSEWSIENLQRKYPVIRFTQSGSPVAGEIEPGSLTVRVGTDIADHEYAKFDGTRLIVSNDDRPSDGALRSRWDSYREREG